MRTKKIRQHFEKNQEKMLKKVIAVVGPTASGKTSLAVEIAKKLGTEIISADSRQVFKDFNIAAAKPAIEEMQGIKHHLLDCVNPTDEFTVADFSDKAQNVMECLFEQGKIPVVAGGTGLYFRILLENFDLPRVSPDKKLREELHNIATTEGPDELFKMLCELDPKLAQTMHPNNTVKIIRALEVCKTLNIPMSEAQKVKQEPEYDVVWLGLGHLNGEDRQLLYARTDKRVDLMLEKGLEQEAKSLFKKYGRIPSLLRTIGYKEFDEYFEGLISYEQAVDKIKQNTRRYAKRQLTWFRKNENVHWLDTIKNTKEQLVFDSLKLINN